MTHFLPSDTPRSAKSVVEQAGSAPDAEMADLRVFWGPEICRLEYLVHLLETGRVVDEYRLETA